MTIALGIICESGIVVAADSEESIPGYMKRDEPKIQVLLTRHAPLLPMPHDGDVEAETVLRRRDRSRPKNVPNTDIAISGAGTASYIDALIPRLTKVLLDDEWLMDEEEIRSRAEVVIRKFYREHVIPFASYPRDERPDVQMLLAYNRGGMRRILVSENTAVRSLHEGDIAAVGAGAFFAKMLLSKFVPIRKLDLRTAQLLAAYAVFRTKETIDGCGKYTSMATIPHTDWFSGEQIAQLDEVFRDQEAIEAEMLMRVFGRHPQGDHDVDAMCALLRSRCDVVFRPYAPETPTTTRSIPEAPKRDRKRQRPSRE